MLIISIVYITIKSKNSNKYDLLLLLETILIIIMSNNNEIWLFNNNISINKVQMIVLLLSMLSVLLINDKDFMKYGLLGTILITISSSKLIFVISLELQSFSIFILISKWKSFNSLQYYLLSSVSTVLLIYGIGINTIIIYIALLFKLSMFPINKYYVEMYNSIPTDISIIIITLPKVSILVWLSKNWVLDNKIIILAILTSIVGSFGSLITEQIRKVITYSSINNVGLIILIIIINSKVWLYYIIQYMISSMLILKVISITIYDLKNLSIYKKWIILVNILSLLSIPITIGFYGKLYVLIESIINKNWLIITIVLLSSMLMGYVYLKIINALIKDNKMIITIEKSKVELITVITITIGLLILDQEIVIHIVKYILEC